MKDSFSNDDINIPEKLNTDETVILLFFIMCEILLIFTFLGTIPFLE